mmetsp:Transcript_19664/g.53946  ORF Transcript_19664/g.53946 Transcript_19664/m.53946 type:complete len:240 (-) Transcript_19664:281-1000(-)
MATPRRQRAVARGRRRQIVAPLRRSRVRCGAPVALTPRHCSRRRLWPSPPRRPCSEGAWAARLWAAAAGPAPRSAPGAAPAPAPAPAISPTPPVATEPALVRVRAPAPASPPHPSSPSASRAETPGQTDFATKVFKSYDRDGTGMLSRQVLSNVLKKLGMGRSEKVLRAYTASGGKTTEQGLICYDDFVTFLFKRSNRSRPSTSQSTLNSSAQSSSDAHLLEAPAQPKKPPPTMPALGE